MSKWICAITAVLQRPEEKIMYFFTWPPSTVNLPNRVAGNGYWKDAEKVMTFKLEKGKSNWVQEDANLLSVSWKLFKTRCKNSSYFKEIIIVQNNMQ